MMRAFEGVSVWLAALVAVGFLLIAPNAHAHVSHGTEAMATPGGVETSSTQFVAPGMLADELSSIGFGIWSSNIGTGPDNKCPNVQTSCCGTGISSCSSAALVEALPAPLLRKLKVVDASLGSPSLTGTSVDRLIRPPRAAV